MLAAMTTFQLAVQAWWSVALLLSGAASLALAVGALLVDWRNRVQIWRTDPAGLAAPLPTHRRYYAVVLLLCGLTGVGAVGAPDAALTPLAVILAAYAALTVGHRRCSTPIGRFGLVLVGWAIITAALAWLPAWLANGSLGAALAGLLLIWLARFWQQQLNAGRPWTTTGRLIPAARQLSWFAVFVEIMLLPPRGRPGVYESWPSLLTYGFMLLHWWALLKDARKQRTRTDSRAA